MTHQPHSAAEILSSTDERITPARTAIIEVLAQAKAPLSVPELLKMLEKRKRLINKTTLYRDLTRFMEKGIVTSIRLNERQTRYELTDLDHHHHVVCTSCDKIADVALTDELAIQEKQIERLTKFKIQRHALEFFGLCAQCQA